MKWCTALALQLIFAPCFWTKIPGKLGIIFARIGHKKQKIASYFWKTSNLAITFNKTRRNMVNHAKKSELETQEMPRYCRRRCERSDLYHFSIWFPTICRRSTKNKVLDFRVKRILWIFLSAKVRYNVFAESWWVL